MSKYQYFELIRQSDDLIYQFDRLKNAHNEIAYKRRDQDLWITFQGALGWVAFDEESKTVLGRPWDILPPQQSASHPPEGIWVSRKNEKSYVYELIYRELKQ